MEAGRARHGHAVSLINFHRLLITAGIVFCLGFGIWGMMVWDLGGGTGTLILGVVFLGLGLGLGYYLINLRRFLGYEEEDGGEEIR